MTAHTIRDHLDMIRSHGQHEYAEWARANYWRIVGEYLR